MVVLLLESGQFLFHRVQLVSWHFPYACFVLERTPSNSQNDQEKWSRWFVLFFRCRWEPDVRDIWGELCTGARRTPSNLFVVALCQSFVRLVFASSRFKQPLADYLLFWSDLEAEQDLVCTLSGISWNHLELRLPPTPAQGGLHLLVKDLSMNGASLGILKNSRNLGTRYGILLLVAHQVLTPRSFLFIVKLVDTDEYGIRLRAPEAFSRRALTVGIWFCWFFCLRFRQGTGVRLTQTQPLQKVPKDAEVQLLSRKIIVHYCIGFGLNHSDVLMFFDVDRLSGFICSSTKDIQLTENSLFLGDALSQIKIKSLQWYK